MLEEDFLQALTKEIDIIFLCNPNNPTGLLVKTIAGKFKSVVELDILMAVDECFLDFVPSPEKYTLKEYLETYDNLFLLKALQSAMLRRRDLAMGFAKIKTSEKIEGGYVSLGMSLPWHRQQVWRLCRKENM